MREGEEQDEVRIQYAIFRVWKYLKIDRYGSQVNRNM